jgi:hypothetical protein
MDPDIDQGTPIILILAFHPADRLLVSVDRAPVLRLQRMHRQECSSESRYKGTSYGSFIDTFSKPMLASPLRAG